MGYHTEPAMAFVMALLNVRLGRWCPNPAGPFTALSSPPLGLWYLLRELFGSVNEDTGFVNVSDGGHFENLGLYELVRRRCRLIVVSDGGQDRNFQLEDLGNAIRKCRVDLGAEIDIDVRPLLPGAAPRQRLAVGRIRYWDDGRQALAGMPPTPECGVLVYLKPMVLGDEPVDVGNYAATHLTSPTSPPPTSGSRGPVRKLSPAGAGHRAPGLRPGTMAAGRRGGRRGLGAGRGRRPGPGSRSGALGAGARRDQLESGVLGAAWGVGLWVATHSSRASTGPRRRRPWGRRPGPPGPSGGRRRR